MIMVFDEVWKVVNDDVALSDLNICILDFHHFYYC